MIPFATPEYARTRTWENWGEGSAEALALMTARLRANEPQCHVRYADGEFYSILGRVGPNADGQEHLPATLGKDLQFTLRQIADERYPNVLVGGYWDLPLGAKAWLIENHLLESVPWCPVQVFVTCINGGTARLTNGDALPEQADWTGPTMAFLDALKNHKGNKYLVANADVGKLAPSFGARHVGVTLPRRKREEVTSPTEIATPNTPGWYGHENAYTGMPEVEAELRKNLKPGDAVIWCAGLGCKPSLWRLFRDCPGTTHIDAGCFFDLAAGLVSRTWMTSPPDARQTVYRNVYIPRLTGK